MIAAYPWRQLAILVGAGLIGVVAIIPYQLALLPGPLPAPLAAIYAGAIAQGTVLLMISAALGLAAARRVGLRAPLSEVIANGGDVREAIRGLHPASSVVIGVAGAALALVIDVAFFSPAVGAIASASGRPERWQAVLASLYGGITEEILTRLFLVSVAAWLLGRVWHGTDGRPTREAFIGAILAAAVLFGAGHLPATAALAALTPALVIRAILINGILGAVFGWLYWRRGLEAAMLAHLVADLLLHVLFG